MAATSERTQGTYYSIADERLAAIVATGIPEDAVIEIALNTDWTEGAEHQQWLDTGAIAKIADWIEGIQSSEPE